MAQSQIDQQLPGMDSESDGESKTVKVVKKKKTGLKRLGGKGTKRPRTQASSDKNWEQMRFEAAYVDPVYKIPVVMPMPNARVACAFLKSIFPDLQLQKDSVSARAQQRKPGSKGLRMDVQCQMIAHGIRVYEVDRDQKRLICGVEPKEED